MKRETLRHPKTLDLAARLGVERPAALGFLTLLWDFTAEYAIQGDVGKWPNAVIASACDYRADPDSFVEALVKSKWLDEDTMHRVVIHDWPHHCERWVKLKMGKLKLTFLQCYGPIEDSPDDSIEPSIERSPSRDRTEPNQSNPLIPDGRLGGRAVELEEIQVDAPLWTQCLPLMDRISKIVGGGKSLKDSDRELCAKSAIVAVRLFGEPWLDDVLKDMKERREPPQRPWGYFKGAIAKSAARAGNDYYAAQRIVKIPPKFLERPKATA